MALPSRSCLISLRDKDLPVPSYLHFVLADCKMAIAIAYPLIVEERNTRYGPNKLLTNGSGIAAASSITTNSACPSF